MKSNRKNKLLNILKASLFGVVFLVLFLPIDYIFKYKVDRREENTSYQLINFYEEKKNSMDAVIVGSSSAYSAYTPVLAWNAYGIKTTNYTAAAMGIMPYKYVIEEVRKNQKDALIVIFVSQIYSEPDFAYHYHYLADFMPLSINKVKFAYDYGKQLNNLGEGLELIIPIIRYHSRLHELEEIDFKSVYNDPTKSSSYYRSFLEGVEDVTDEYVFSDARKDVPEYTKEVFEDLLNYCDEKKESNILFVIAPRANDIDEVGMRNSLADYIKSRGYRTVDLLNGIKSAEIDMSEDFFNVKHLNIHGSIKFTDYFARYLIENYGLKARREDKDSTEWDSAFDCYMDIINPYILDNEIDIQSRDFNLAKPEMTMNENTLSWNEIEGAEGYMIYENSGKGWELIKDTKELSYDVVNADGRYTVVPYSGASGTRKYGCFDYVGISPTEEQQ